MKRKRKCPENRDSNKRLKAGQHIDCRSPHPLLRKYYPNVLTLRRYLQSRVLNLSKNQRKRVQQYGQDINSPFDSQAVELLDSTIIGSFDHLPAEDVRLNDDITVYTQVNQSSTLTTSTPGEVKQREIIDFVIWLLFRKSPRGQRPRHVLCQRFVTASHSGFDALFETNIPGILSTGRNDHVEILKQSPWNALPDILGKSAERVLVDLFVNCGIFTPTGNKDNSNLIQRSGIPLHDLDILSDPSKSGPLAAEHGGVEANPRPHAKGHRPKPLSKIRLGRHKLLYSRPVLSANHGVRFGLNQTHVLNRYYVVENTLETIHVMRYIFPAQFGLHNVFTSALGPKDASQPFKDYTFREQEIQEHNRAQLGPKRTEGLPSEKQMPLVPKRMKGEIQKLIQRLRKLHQNCPYPALLDHYCPRAGQEESDLTKSVRQATPIAQVSAFCRAIVNRVFPSELWGNTNVNMQNQKILHRNIDRFVRFRRYESMTMHNIIHQMQIGGVEWLAPPNISPGMRLSQTDFDKRKELFSELLYYLFDSFLIPVIRGHFYVTESSLHRNRLFFFRHDVWRALSEPALTSFKDLTLEECSGAWVRKVLAKRALGVSHVRMMPKEQGMRPIINLRRRVQRLKSGKLTFGKSINSILAPTFSVLNHGKAVAPELLGSALLSVADIFPRLQRYRQLLIQNGLAGKPLYFAKVDVQSCFDTIPQQGLLRLASTILRSDQYSIQRYSRGRLIGSGNSESLGFGTKPSWRFLTKATAADAEGVGFAHEVETDASDGRRGTVYVDGNPQRSESRQSILALLEEHIGSNLIKIGKRFYRQKEGIPQGSIVSSLLCSYFYTQLEHDALGFVDTGTSLLLRLIDDFLIITPHRSVAEQFVRVMHGGLPRFGVQVKAEKSRANFTICVADKIVTQVPEEVDFPYCGIAINTKTLDISKDQERRQQMDIRSSVTVEFSSVPGQTFYGKMLNALKLQMQSMLLSTKFNGFATVITNLYHIFGDVAQKAYYYVKALPVAKQPTARLMIKTIDETIKLARMLMKRRRCSRKDSMPYECVINNDQVQWLACTAFLSVLGRRQTKHAVAVAWLQRQLGRPALQEQHRLLQPLVHGVLSGAD